ncbi:NUMOD4 domain-containing protein [Saccharicrinis aurantiacus]|uniref:NUMOD4 domain-containing protein n=1 Tax=Saccharicrinis aurantiacus TaxID=1849719 RepID=UPI00249392A0|nr:NUMOD4 domain-containing protein [Saccharicrinis aurantiacus]
MDLIFNQAKLTKLTNEKWKTIADSNNKYSISNYGRIISFYTSKPEGKFVKQGQIKGYKSVNIIINSKKKTCLVHKLVAEAFIAKDNDLQEVVGHKDWNKTNNRVSNLMWMTKVESFNRAKERMTKARQEKGGIVTRSKLKPKDVNAIKIMLKKGHKQKVIAQLFCVSEMQISRIKNKACWASV